MQWKVKYEDYSGEIHVVTVSGYTERHAISQLVACKEVYSSLPVDNEELTERMKLWK